ncbi:hypothetical protein APHCR_0741 [Anaplasma phagocytophilum str. CR1007]|nr:hypothetical protein APHCR_0741 [Anaplasma phagocytophilum str. CR1007]
MIFNESMGKTQGIKFSSTPPAKASTNASNNVVSIRFYPLRYSECIKTVSFS